jgi:hypothetical protein
MGQTSRPPCSIAYLAIPGRDRDSTRTSSNTTRTCNTVADG